MTLDELSTTFDILYNNISSNQAPGLTEYEKSVFLTQAQEAVILDLYKGVTGDSFETTEEVTRYLSSLVKTKEFNIPNPLILNTFISGVYEYKVESSELEDLMFITYQAGSINVMSEKRDVLVVPSKQDSLFRELNNPFRGPNKNRFFSLSEDNYITLYSKYPIITYYVKYLSRPYPIILEDLAEIDKDGNPVGEYLTINKEYESKEITWLPESLHNQILVRAVQIAKSVWAS